MTVSDILCAATRYRQELVSCRAVDDFHAVDDFSPSVTKPEFDAMAIARDKMTIAAYVTSYVHACPGGDNVSEHPWQGIV